MAESKRTKTALNAAPGVKSTVNDAKYTFAEFVANPDALGATVDIVKAALREKGVTEATVAEAKAIVKEFKERKL